MAKPFNLDEYVESYAPPSENASFDIDSYVAQATPIPEETAKEIRAGRITTSPVDETIAEAEKIQSGGVKVDPITAIAGQALSTATFKVADKLVNAFGDEEYEKFVEKASSDNLLINISGNLIGYLLNPAGRAIRGATARNKAGVIKSAVMEVAGVEGGAAAVDLIDTALKAPGEFKEALTREGVELGIELVGAGLGSAVLKGILNPGKFIDDAVKGTPGLQKVLNKVKQAYPQKTKELLDNAADIVKNEGAEGLSRKVAMEFDELSGKLAQAKEKAVADGLEQVATLSDEIQGSVNRHLDNVVKGLDDPKKSIEALVGVADDIKIAEDGMSSMYDIHLDKIKGLTQGKKVSLGQRKKDVLEIFELEGLIDNKGNFVNKTLKSQYPAAEKMIRELASTDEVTHQQLGQLVKFLGSAFEEAGPNVNANVVNQARKAYTGLKKTLVDPEIWGKEAAVITEDMLSQYSTTKQLFSSLRKSTSESIKPGLSRLKSEPTLELFEQLAKGFQTADTAASKIQGFKSYSALVPDNVQNKIKIGLKESKKLVSYEKARNGAKAKKILSQAFKTQDPSKIKDAVLEQAIRDYAQMDEFLEQAGLELQGLPDLQAAFENPMDSKLVNRAVKWADKYAKQISPDLKDNINALAKFNRIAKIKPNQSALSKELKVAKELLDPTDYKAVKLFAEFAPEAEGVIRDIGLHDMIKNKNTSLLQYLPQGGAGIAASLWETAALPLIILGNIAKDPVAFKMFIEKGAQKGISPAKFQAITKAAQMSSIIAEEMNNQE